MPNQVAGFYTTNQQYRATASNHIYGYKYDKPNLTLYIQFYNTAVYKYLGVQPGVVEGFEKAQSHGVFLWQNIRQRFPYSKIGNKPLGYLSQLDNPYYELFPDLAKLDKLDEQELKVRKQYEKGSISSKEFHRFMDILELKKEKVIVKLEKDGYSFDEDDDSQDSQDPDSSTGTGLGNVGNICNGLLAALGVIGEVALILMKGTAQIMGMFVALGAILGSSRR